MARMPGGRRRPVVHVCCSFSPPARIARREADYLHLHTLLRRHALAEPCLVHAWSILPERVSLVLTVLGRGSAEGYLGRVFDDHGRYWEQEHCRALDREAGHLGIEPVGGQPAAVLAAMRDVELAPVRAGRVRRPEEWPHTSARWHLFGEAEDLVIDHLAWVRLGIDAQTRRYVYAEAMRLANPDPVRAAVEQVIRARAAAR